MQIDVTQVLTTLAGNPIKEVDEQGQAQDVTLRMVAVNGLLAPVQQESGTEKLRKYELARKVFGTDVVELTTDEVALIKKRILEVFAPLVAGQAAGMLEGSKV